MATRPLTPAQTVAAQCNSRHFFQVTETDDGRRIWQCCRCGSTKGFGVAS